MLPRGPIGSRTTKLVSRAAGRHQPRQKLASDGYQREVKSMIDAADVAAELHLPLLPGKACKPWRSFRTSRE